MIVRALSLTLAVVVAGGILASEAGADHRKRHRRDVERYYGPPEVFVGVPGLRLFFGDYALSPEEYDALYGREPRNFDESYYEPEPITPKPKKKPVAKAVKTAPPAAAAAAPRDSQPADNQTTASLAPQSGSTGKAAAKPAAKNAVLSCDKAGGVVSGYGFSDVTAASCEGKVYAFNATRAGKSFSVKLDPATGELTEVKKLP